MILVGYLWGNEREKTRTTQHYETRARMLARPSSDAYKIEGRMGKGRQREARVII